MSDEALRALERRWRASGSTADEADYLRERVRVGDLAPDALALAAYCGHAAARLAQDVSEPSETIADPNALHRWADGLAPWGPSVTVRAALAAVEITPDPDGVFPGLTRACRAWLVLARVRS